MAWTGDVERRIVAALPVAVDRIVGGIRKTTFACRLMLECGHEQPSDVLPSDAVRLRKTVCVACSKPNWDPIGAIRESITFDEVLEKLRKLR